jgi:phage major head subunit gpT-like protein
MLAVTRQDLINDDLGALTSAPRRLGRGGAIKLNKVFWTEFEADAGTFWTSDRGNYFSGASTNLQISSLTTAVQKFRDQTDPDGDPLSLAPRKLLVPTALEVTAQNLFSGANIVVGALGSTTSKSIQPDVNPHAGRYQPVVSAYLSNATAWWLLADPEDLATIEVAFLNGQESPTVEQADADFNTLGIQMRGYFDFGVNKQEYRAGVKSKGAA